MKFKIIQCSNASRLPFFFSIHMTYFKVNQKIIRQIVSLVQQVLVKITYLVIKKIVCLFFDDHYFVLTFIISLYL